jgi:hypothetical protein
MNSTECHQKEIYAIALSACKRGCALPHAPFKSKDVAQECEKIGDVRKANGD